MSLRTSITCITFSLLLAVGVSGVLADDKLENQELHISLQVAAAKIQAQDAQLLAAKDKNDALAQSAAAANAAAPCIKPSKRRPYKLRDACMDFIS